MDIAEAGFNFRSGTSSLKKGTRMTTRILSVTLASFLAPSTLFATFSNGFAGVDTIMVMVEKLPKAANDHGLTKKSILSDVTLKLRLAGIVTGEFTPRHPHVYVNVNVISVNSGKSSVYNVGVSLKHTVRTDFNHYVFGAETSTVGMLGITPAREMSRDVRDAIKDHMDLFLNAYLKENPRGR